MFMRSSVSRSSGTAGYISTPDTEMEREFLDALQGALKDGQVEGLEKCAALITSFPDYCEKALEDNTGNEVPMGNFRAVKSVFERALSKRKCSPIPERTSSKKATAQIAADAALAEKIAREGMDVDDQMDTRPAKKGLLTPKFKVDLGANLKGKGKGKGNKGKGKKDPKADSGKHNKGGKGKGNSTYGQMLDRSDLPLGDIMTDDVDDDQIRKALVKVDYGALKANWSAQAALKMAKELAEAQPVALLFTKYATADPRQFQEALNTIQDLPSEKGNEDFLAAISFDRRTGLSLRWAIKMSKTAHIIEQATYDWLKQNDMEKIVRLTTDQMTLKNSFDAWCKEGAVFFQTLLKMEPWTLKLSFPRERPNGCDFAYLLEGKVVITCKACYRTMVLTITAHETLSGKLSTNDFQHMERLKTAIFICEFDEFKSELELVGSALASAKKAYSNNPFQKSIMVASHAPSPTRSSPPPPSCRISR